tara:strand:- start:1240 stop:1722 length:483 start_codon:yes stop_codon:yes gene_type:complete
MAFAIVKPSDAGNTISRLVSGSVNADFTSQAQRFYMKIGSYVLAPKNKPFDVTAEGDSFTDIRHLGFIGGGFQLVGWMVNQPVQFDELKNTSNNKNVQISLTFGKDSDDATTRFVSFDSLITAVQIQYNRSAVFVPVSITGLFTNSWDGTNVLYEQEIGA